MAFVFIIAVLWAARGRRWWLFKRANPAPADNRRRKKGATLILSRVYRLMACAWKRRWGKNTRGRRTVFPSPGGCTIDTLGSHDREDVRNGFIGRYFFRRILRTARGKNITTVCAETNFDGPSTVPPTTAAKGAPRKSTATPTKTAVDLTTTPDENNDHRGSNKNDDDDDGNGSGESLPGNGWPSSLLSSWAEAALFEAGRVAGTFVRVVVVRPLAYVSGRGTKRHTSASQPRTKSNPVSAKSRGRKTKSNNPRGTGAVAPKGPRIAAKGEGKTQGKPAGVREPPMECPTDGDVNLPGTFAGANTCRMPPVSGAGVNRLVPPGRLVGAGKDRAEEVAAKTDPVSGSGGWTSVLDGLSRDPGNR